MKYALLDETVHFYFAANDTAGSGADGATPVFSVRRAGAAAGAAPVITGTPTLLTHASFPNGCFECAVPLLAASGFLAEEHYAVFSTIAVDGQNPAGLVGEVKIGSVLSQLADTEHGGVNTVFTYERMRGVCLTSNEPCVQNIGNGTGAGTHNLGVGVNSIGLLNESPSFGQRNIANGTAGAIGGVGLQNFGFGPGAGHTNVGGDTGDGQVNQGGLTDGVGLYNIGNGSSPALYNYSNGDAYAAQFSNPLANGPACIALLPGTSSDGIQISLTAGSGNGFSIIGGDLGDDIFLDNARAPTLRDAILTAGAIDAIVAPLLANLDAAISTRLATAGYTAPLTAAATRAAVGMAAANLDTQLSGILTAIGSGGISVEQIAGMVIEEEGPVPATQPELTLRGAMRLLTAIATGLSSRETSNDNLVLSFRDTNDRITRVSMTLNTYNDRTEVNKDISDPV